MASAASVVAADLQAPRSFFPAATSYEYLEQHKIRFHLEDAICQLLDAQPDNPLLFLHSYFDKVRRGSNVLGREFEYIRSTPRNRLAFAQRLSEVVRQVTEIHQLAQLVCPDFPIGILRRVGQVVCYQHNVRVKGVPAALDVTADLDGADCRLVDDEPVVPCKAFMAAFKVCFVYHEFMEHLIEIVKDTISSFHGALLGNMHGVAGQPPSYTPGERRELERATTERVACLAKTYNATPAGGGCSGRMCPPAASIEHALERAYSSSRLGTTKAADQPTGTGGADSAMLDAASTVFYETWTGLLGDKQVYEHLDSSGL
ncbi:hypothetical protein BC831DRAFT_510167 [Entophlyctis helioformis]|nr:hypothetical protein BC831DRAFT_510167 [Entophlyctis helioformis]